MEVEVEQLTIPETDFKSTITMPASEFQRIVRDLQVLGDACVISCNKEGIQFSVSGSIGTGNILIRSNPNAEKEEDKVEIDMQEEVELNFALRYLNFFTKATPLSDKVVISLSPELPMCVEYPIEDQGSIKFFLAPKIEVRIGCVLFACWYFSLFCVLVCIHPSILLEKKVFGSPVLLLLCRTMTRMKMRTKWGKYPYLGFTFIIYYWQCLRRRLY